MRERLRESKQAQEDLGVSFELPSVYLERSRTCNDHDVPIVKPEV
jgi:hypothetical protein